MNESVSFSIFLKDYFSNPLQKAQKTADSAFDAMEDNLDDLDRKAKQSGKNMEVSLGGAFRSIGRLVGSLGVTLGGAAAIIGSGKLGIQAEQTDVAFTTMIGSAERAKNTIAELSDFAAKTPYGKREVLDSGKQLLAYGFSAEEVRTKLTQIGDVASGLGQPLGEMAYLFGTIKTQGKAMTMDIRQFANRGVPIYEELAKVLGITTDQVNEFAEDGKISFGVIEQAFSNMSAKGGKFFNMMDSQSQTAGGRLATMFDNLSALGEKLGLAMLPAINSVTSLASVLLDNLMPVINAVAPIFKWIGENLKTILSVITPLLAAWTAYSAITKIAAAWTALQTGAQWALNVALNANPIGLVVAGIAGLVAILTIAWKKSETFRGVVLGLWEVMKKFASGLGDLFTSPMETIKKAFTGIVDFFKKQVSPIFELIQAIKEGRWMDAAKAGGRLLLNLSPVGLAVNVGKEIVNSSAFKSGFAKGKNKHGEAGALDELTSGNMSLTDLAKATGATSKAASNTGAGLVGISADEKTARNLQITINGGLVGELSLHSTNINEGIGDLKAKITEALTDAVRDFELSY